MPTSAKKTSWLGSLAFPARLTQARHAIHLWVQPVRARMGYGLRFNHRSKHSLYKTSSASLEKGKEEEEKVRSRPSSLSTVTGSEVETVATELERKLCPFVHIAPCPLHHVSRALSFSLIFPCHSHAASFDLPSHGPCG